MNDPAPNSPLPSQDGLYCPGCGYDLRGLGSERCPECGLTIDRSRSGIIAWENRKSIGYFRSFVRTLVAATFSPVRLARATGSPMDVRSARLFRWIVRLLFFLPCLGVFIYAVIINDGPDKLALVTDSTLGSTVPFWEAQFVWSVGATCWPVLPVGFLITLVLSSGVSHWFCMKRQELVRRNRSMVFSFYLCAPLAWIFIPALSAAVLVYLSTRADADASPTIANIALAFGWTTSLSSFLIVLALLNQLRAVNAATTCGFARALLVGVGVIFQCAVAVVLGLGFFPLLAGIVRLVWLSLRR